MASIGNTEVDRDYIREEHAEHELDFEFPLLQAHG